MLFKKGQALIQLARPSAAKIVSTGNLPKGCETKRMERRSEEIGPQLLAVKAPVNLGDALFPRLLAAVATGRQEQALRYHKRSDAVASLLADLLTRFAAGVALGIARDQMAFAATPHGKPILAGHPDYHFNISHSGSWIVLAQHPADVGVDVEMIRPVNLRIAKRHFSATETADLLAQTTAERPGYFFDLWTLKESYVKAIGTGLRIPLSSFTVRKTDSGIALTRHDPQLPLYAFRQYDIDPACRLSVCAAIDSFPPHARLVAFSELCAYHGIACAEPEKKSGITTPSQ